MTLALALLVLLLTVPLAGGRLGALGDVQIRWIGLAAGAFAVQVFIVVVVPDGWPGANVFSVGDVLMLLGVILAIHAVAGSRLTGGERTELQRSQESPAAR